SGGKQRHGGVLGCCERGQQIVLLKQKPEIPSAENDLLPAREPLHSLAQHCDLAAVAIKQAGYYRKHGRLSAPPGPHRQRHRPIADFQVYAPPRQHFSAAVSELLTHAPAVNCDFWTHLFYPRKTCAGSKTRTRRTLIRLAKITTNKMATPVPTTFCQI